MSTLDGGSFVVIQASEHGVQPYRQVSVQQWMKSRIHTARPAEGNNKSQYSHSI